MTIRPWLAAGLSVTALAVAPAAWSQAQPAFAGAWTGVLETSEPVWVELVFEPGPRARVKTRPVNQALGGERLKPSALRIEGDTVHIEFRQISGVFEGRLTNSGRIDGVWRQPDETVRVSLYRQGGPARSSPRPPPSPTGR
jgi:hypothetical protein